jgi:hypothetical protein
MKNGVVRSVATVAGVAMALCLVPAHVATQSGAAAPTPLAADGHPDLSGRWGGGGQGGTVTAINDQGELVEYENFAEIGDDNVRVLARMVTYRKGNPTFGERDAGMYQRLFSNPPLYKPEHWEQVQFLDMHGNYEDSAFHCMPTGVPRMGPPVKIVQLADEMIFMYNAGNVFRIIPTDGRPHDPVASLDQTFMGDSIGRWEGDTLVVDVVGFNQETWIGWPGWFHTADMRVEERLRREGNTLHYQATVYDPEILVEPYVMDPLVRELNTSGGAYIEQPPCVTSTHAMVGRERG